MRAVVDLAAEVVLEDVFGADAVFDALLTLTKKHSSKMPWKKFSRMFSRISLSMSWWCEWT